MSDAAIEMRALTKRYRTALAVDRLDLVVPRGSVFGLLGPNGAGKSTTFGILCGWLRQTSGEATVLGVPSRRVFTLRGRVTALPQDSRFPPRIAVERALEHYGRLSGMSAADARSSAGCALERVAMQPAAKLRGAELSHGMLKRVALAQALLGRPELVFLDEPTAGLDPKVAFDVKRLIAGLAPVATVVVSSHNLTELQEICTHGAILDRGRLVQTGTIEELTRRHAEIAIEVTAGASLPEPELRARFGAEAVSVTAAAGRPTVVRIRFAGERDVSEVIGEALAVLLAARTPILGVQRGTSLEKAFLEATARA